MTKQTFSTLSGAAGGDLAGTYPNPTIAAILSGKTFQPASAGSVAEIIKGLASQTGDLSQWQDSNANVLGKVTYQGSPLFQGSASPSLGAPPTTPTLNTNSTTGGTLAAGIWRYMTTNVDATGLESPSSTNAGAVTTGSTSALTINVPAGPAGTLKRNVYRSLINSQVYYFLAQIADNTTLTYQDTGSVVLSTKSAPLGPNQALAMIGNAPFDGSTSGFFAGVAPQGTALAVNMAAAFTGSLVDLQSGGASKFSVSASGALTAALTGAFGSTVSGAAMKSGSYQDAAATGVFLTVTTTTATITGRGTTSATEFVVKGMAAQTGDLQQWQNNTPTTLAGVRIDGLIYATGTGTGATNAGLATAVKAGTPSDADWTVAPVSGTIIGDSTGSKIWIRLGSTWKSVAVT